MMPSRVKLRSKKWTSSLVHWMEVQWLGNQKSTNLEIYVVQLGGESFVIIRCDKRGEIRESKERLKVISSESPQNGYLSLQGIPTTTRCLPNKQQD